MKKRYVSAALLAFFAIDAISLHAQSITSLNRLSINAANEGGDASSDRISFSANGRLVAFESNAGNLVSSDQNSSTDIFVRDIITGALSRVNVALDGSEADASSSNPAISARAINGFFAVVYESNSTNLNRFPSLPDNNNNTDIYISFPLINYSERVTFGADFTQANGDSFDPSVAIIPEPNRALITYASDASNLVISDVNSRRDVFLTTMPEPSNINSFDPRTEIVTRRITTGINNGGEPTGDSNSPVISGNGRYIAYESDATNLVEGSFDVGVKQIYLYDINEDTTTIISKNAAGAAGNGDSIKPSISYNGSFITFLTKATNLLTDGSSASSDTLQIVHYDVTTDVATRVNTSPSGSAGNSTDDSDMSARISPNGRFVAFADASSNLVSGDTNSNVDVFVRDMRSGLISLVSRSSSGGSADGISRFPGLGGTSYTSNVAGLPFSSTATNLVSSDTEGRPDTFIAQVAATLLPLTPSTVLEVPPDTSVNGRQINLTFEAFDGIDPQKAKRRLSSRSFPIAGAKKITMRYVAQVFKENPKNQKLKRFREKATKRNELALKNLKPGTYSVNYQARIMQGKKVISRTAPSPGQRFVIN